MNCVSQLLASKLFIFLSFFAQGNQLRRFCVSVVEVML
jgi:hypothetical protein